MLQLHIAKTSNGHLNDASADRLRVWF